MKAKNKIKAIAAGLMFISATPSFAQDKTGGGGDGLEIKVLEITQNLSTWIKIGGAKGLQLGKVSYSEYERKMLEILEPFAVKVTFTNSVINFEGRPKTCIWTKTSEDKPEIFCNIRRFRALSEDEKYQLVHHEFAGIAGIELPIESTSNYSVSNQIKDVFAPNISVNLKVKGKKDIYYNSFDKKIISPFWQGILETSPVTVLVAGYLNEKGLVITGLKHAAESSLGATIVKYSNSFITQNTVLVPNQLSKLCHVMGFRRGYYEYASYEIPSEIFEGQVKNFESVIKGKSGFWLLQPDGSMKLISKMMCLK